MSKREVMLTTEDNPYDPFDDFDNWYRFDIQKGYDSCGYLARVAHTSDAFPPSDNDAIIEAAMDEIVELNLTGNYKKLVREIES